MKKASHLLMGAFVFTACASYPKPVESLAASEASVRTAQEMGPQKVPAAALQYELATEELNKAQEALKKNDNEKADQWLSRSRADAELAIALIQQTNAQSQADAAAAQLRDAQQLKPASTRTGTPQ
jgi:hypothetical protein